MIPDRILLVLPTRNRRWQALEALASAFRTAANPDRVSAAIMQDSDDPDAIVLMGRNVYSFIGERRRFCPTVNDAVMTHVNDFEWVAWLADDIRYETQGWDDLVTAQNELVVYGDDGIRHEIMPTHPFVRTILPRALGYFLPPELVHQFPDIFIGDLARELKSIKYLPDLKTTHYHYTVGKAERDQNYIDSEQTFDRDKAVYDSMIYPDLPRLAQKYRDYVANQSK